MASPSVEEIATFHLGVRGTPFSRLIDPLLAAFQNPVIKVPGVVLPKNPLPVFP
jgi:hypothetical protein